MATRGWAGGRGVESHQALKTPTDPVRRARNSALYRIDVLAEVGPGIRGLPLWPGGGGAGPASARRPRSPPPAARTGRALAHMARAAANSRAAAETTSHAGRPMVAGTPCSPAAARDGRPGGVRDRKVAPSSGVGNNR